MSKPRVWVLIGLYENSDSDVIAVHATPEAADANLLRINRRLARYKKEYQKWVDDESGKVRIPDEVPHAYADGFFIKPMVLK